MLKFYKFLVCLIGFQLSGCAAMNDQDYDSEDNAQGAASEFHGLGTSSGLQIKDGDFIIATQPLPFVAYYAYVNQWAEQGMAQPFSDVTVEVHMRGNGDLSVLKRFDRLPVGAEASFGAISVNLTGITTNPSIACNTFDYSNVPIMESDSRIIVTAVDENYDGIMDLNKLLVYASFAAEVPLQSNNCVSKKYTFEAPAEIILYPDSVSSQAPTFSSPTSTQPPPYNPPYNPPAQCKFKHFFGRVEWFPSGTRRNRCLCDNGTWYPEPGQYCKNWD